MSYELKLQTVSLYPPSPLSSPCPSRRGLSATSPVTFHFSRSASNDRDEEELTDSPLLKTHHKENLFNIRKISQIPSPIIITDTQGKIRMINSAALKLLGLTEEDVGDKSIDQIMPSELQALYKKHFMHFVARSTQELDSPIAVTIAKISGTVEEIHISLNLFRYIHKEVLVFSIFTKSSSTQEHDKITAVAQKFIEEMRTKWECYCTFLKALQEIESDRNSLLANFTHELGNEAHVATNLLGLAMRDMPKVEENLNMAYESCSKIGQLTKDGMQLFKKTPLHETHFMLCTEIKKIVTRLKVLVEVEMSDKSSRDLNKSRDSGIKFIYQNTIEEEVAIFMDFSKFAQVIQNLVLNAKSFTSNGSITLILNVEEVETEDGNQKGLLSFSVIDTGIGIPKDKLSHLFVPFTPKASAPRRLKREHGGSGLGLSICETLIKQLCGTTQVEGPAIQVESPVTHPDGTQSGTRFFGRVPFLFSRHKTEALLAEPSSEPSEQVTSSSPANLLLAEDNTINQKLFKNMVNPKERVNPDKIEIAGNGQESVDAYMKAADLGNPPHIIFMDKDMPVMNGLEAAQKIVAYWKEHYQAVYEKPVIILASASAMDTSDENITDTLAKPYNKNDLQQILTKYLSSRGNKKEEGKG